MIKLVARPDGQGHISTFRPAKAREGSNKKKKDRDEREREKVKQTVDVSASLPFPFPFAPPAAISFQECFNFRDSFCLSSGGWMARSSAGET